SLVISSYMACNCFCSHVSNGRSVEAFILVRAVSPARSFLGLSSLAMARPPRNKNHSADSCPRHNTLLVRMPVFVSLVHDMIARISASPGQGRPASQPQRAARAPGQRLVAQSAHLPVGAAR